QQTALARQFITRTNTGREQDDIGFKYRTISELHYMLGSITIFNTRGGLLSMYLDTKVFNFRAQYPAAQIINLHRHQTWRKLDNMGFQIQISQGFGCLQTQQTTANHYAGFYIQAGCTNRIQILNGAVNKTVLTIIARDWRHKSIRA